MKEFQKAINSILNESPEWVTIAEPRPDPSSVSIEFSKNKEDGKLDYIDSFNSYDVWRMTSDLGVTLYFSPDDNIANAVVEFKESSAGIVVSKIWQNREFKGLARDIYTNYLLPKYSRIFTGDMTIEGLDFHKRLHASGIDVKVVDKTTGGFFTVDTPDELEEYFGKDKGKYLFVLSK